MSAPRFGEQRLFGSRSAGERLLFQAMGVADPAHYLHGRYFQKAIRLLDPRGVRRCLDAGCGRGDYSLYLARRFPEAEVLGVDLNPKLIERNRKIAREMGLTNVSFEIGDLTKLEARSEFDFVVCIDVLEHIVEQRKALENVAHALRPGASGFLHIPTVRTRPVPLHGLLKGFLEWGEEEHIAEDITAETFVSRVREAGLDVAWHGKTFAYYTGELATSLFAIPYENNLRNRILQAGLAPLCRGLALLDTLPFGGTRYAVGVAIRKPA